MSKTAIVTDSASDLSERVLEEYRHRGLDIGIAQVKMSFLNHPTIPPEKWFEQREVETKWIYEQLDKKGRDGNRVIAKTSAADDKGFILAYGNAFSQGYENILVLTIAEVISATYSAALKAASEEEFVGKRIEVVDSKTAVTGQRLIVQRAAEKLIRGEEFEEVVNSAKEDAEKVDMRAVITDLMYLSESGRISKVNAMLASALRAKPLIRINKEKKEGEDAVSLLSKNVFRDPSTALVQFVENYLKNKGLVGLPADYFEKTLTGAIVSFGMPDECKTLQARIEEKLGLVIPVDYEGNPVLAAAAGRVYAVFLI